MSDPEKQCNKIPQSTISMSGAENEHKKTTVKPQRTVSISDPENEPKKKRKVIKSEGRAMIARVYHFLQEEYNFMKAANHDNCDLTPLAQIRKRTALATGVSEHTVSTILKEEKELPSPTADFPSPMAKRRKRDSKFDLDSEKLKIIRSTVQKYYSEHNNKYPSLSQLKSILREKIGFDGCLNTLRTLLKKIGLQLRTKAPKKVNKQDQNMMISSTSSKNEHSQQENQVHEFSEPNLWVPYGGYY